MKTWKMIILIQCLWTVPFLVLICPLLTKAKGMEQQESVNHFYYNEEAELSLQPRLMSAPVVYDEASDEEEIAASQNAIATYTLSQRKNMCRDYLMQRISSFDEAIYVYPFGLSSEEFLEVFSSLVNSNPDMFYLGDSYRKRSLDISDSDTEENLVVERIRGFYAYQNEDYTPQEDVILEKQTQIEKAADDWKKEFNLSEEMDDYIKALIIHDAIVSKTAYMETPSNQSEYTIEGVFLNGEAVCQGYALAYNYLCSKVGLEAKYVHTNDHAWNIVKIDDHWYHVDPTKDDVIEDLMGYVCHDYILLSDADIRKTHGEFQSDEKCNTSVDTDFLKEIVSTVWNYNGTLYFRSKDGTIQQRNKINGKTTPALYTAPVLPQYSSLALCNDYLYYNTPEGISVWWLKDPKKSGEAMSKESNCYGLSISYKNGIPSLLMATQEAGKPVDEKQTVHTITLGGYPFTTDTISFVKNDSYTIDSLYGMTLLADDSSIIITGNTVSATRAGEYYVLAKDRYYYKRLHVSVKPNNTLPDNHVIPDVSCTEQPQPTLTETPAISSNPEESATSYPEENKRTGFVKLSDKTYYFTKDGLLFKGWKKIGKKRYYFHKTKGYMYTGYHKIGKKYYYFSKKGIMQKSKWVKIHGKWKYFDKNGQWNSTRTKKIKRTQMKGSIRYENKFS